MLSACGDAPADIAPVRHGNSAAASTDTDRRIRYAVDRQPVVQFPDGHQRRIASLLSLPRKMRFGDYAWDDPRTGTGTVWIRVDLPRQLISVFRDGDEIGTAVVLYGTDGKDTPSGSFTLLGKERMHRSSLYDADMPFTLWLTHDGVAIHASSVERGRATHGCIGVPLDFARHVFAVAQRGDSVIVLPADRTS